MEERGSPWEALRVHMLKIHGKKDLKISGRKVQAFKGQELFPFCASICHPYQTSCLCRSAQISSSMQAAILTTSVPSQQAFLSRAAVLPPWHRKRMGVFTLISQKKNIFWLQRSCYCYFIGARRGGYIRMINGSRGKEERGGKSVSSRRAEDIILNVIVRQLRAENMVTLLCIYTSSSPCLAPPACCGTYVTYHIMPQMPQHGGRKSRVTSLPLTVYWYSQQKS